MNSIIATLPAPVTSDLAALEQALASESQGNGNDLSKQVRVRHGVYSLRGRPGHFILRIRVPAGLVSPDQLLIIADLTTDAGSTDGAHLTTRAGVEIAGVSGGQVLSFIQRIEAAGLSTFGTGGPVVRGVVCCPRSGVACDEIFDVSAIALAADHYFGRHPKFQHLPRKIKLAFESCADDHVRTTVADIGVRAVRGANGAGFRVTVGGGLGASPKAGQVIEDFVRPEELFPLIAAILSAFDRHGFRQNRSRARLKWLLAEWGLERFREVVNQERIHSAHRSPYKFPPVEMALSHVWDAVAATHQVSTEGTRYDQWRLANAISQKQRDLSLLTVLCPGGDLHPAQLRALAAAASSMGCDVRISIEQNLVLRGVPNGRLPEIYAELDAVGLAGSPAGGLMDVTRCAGASTCLAAITNSKAAASAIARQLDVTWVDAPPEIRELRIRVSGCPNSCGHHHAADVGFFGVSKAVQGRPVPHYVMLLGGMSLGQLFGARVAEIPASRVPQAVDQVLRFYRAERNPHETFSDFVKRVGLPQFRERLSPLLHLPAPDLEPAAYRDLGSDKEFTVGAKGGECAA